MSKSSDAKYRWCATTDDTVQHAHRVGWLYGERLCRPGYQVMDPTYWKKNVQPHKRCKDCESVMSKETKR